MQIRRLAVSEAVGDNRSGRFHGIIHELARRIPEIEHVTGGEHMAGWRAKILDRAFKSNDAQQDWWRRQRNPLAYIAKSDYVEQQILAKEPQPDLCIQMLQHFCPFAVSRKIPYVVYLDYTMAQAAERYPPWTRGRSKLELFCHIRDERRALRHALHNFTFTENTRHFIIERFGIPAEHVTAVGVGAPHREETPRATINPMKLLYVGHEFERKGGQYLYEAFNLLRRKYPELSLTVAGNDAAEPPEGATRLGRVSDPAVMNQLYAESGIFVLPSLCDPSPLVIVEAMHHGLPVVATDVDGIPEMVQDGVTGRLVPPRNSHTLAEAIESLITRTPEELLAMGKAGRAHALATFNWERVGDKTWEVLERL